MNIKHLTLAGMLLALALLLPFVTGQIPEVGAMLAPMHLPVLLCGFICGPIYGGAVGLAAPVLRHFLLGMPPLLTALPMMPELALYGVVTGLLYRFLSRKFHKIPAIYASLIIAMIAGRIAWGVASLAILTAAGDTFTQAAFIAGAITNALPGIIVQLILVPLVITALERARLIG